MDLKNTQYRLLLNAQWVTLKYAFSFLLNNNETRLYDFMWESHLNQACRLLFERPVLW